MGQKISIDSDSGPHAIPNALSRLGLAPGADQKAIRQAYARELKLIDQEADIAGFQALREAYECLRATPLPQSAVPDAVDDAEDAYAWIVAATSVISSGRRIADESIWVKDLIEQLTEQRPSSIDAGWRLEAALGRLLLQGWKPGHEALFLAAVEYFGWAEEGSWPNAQLADAWFEHFILHRQPEGLRSPLVRVIRDLRQTHEPDISRLRRDHGYLEHLAIYYVNLLPLITDLGMLKRWQQLAIPLGKAPDVSWRPPVGEQNESVALQLLKIALIVLTLLAFLSMRI